MVSYAYKICKERGFFCDLYHDILINTSGKNPRTIEIYRDLLYLGIETYEYKVVNTHNKDIAAVPDPAKFNFQLLNYELYKI